MPKSRTDFQIGLDGLLTEKFNSNDTFRTFLINKVRELSTKLERLQNVRFFVKGGTALKLITLKNNNWEPDPDDPKSGEWSDWDTELIINPGLSKQQWYDTFQNVQRLIISHIMYMQIEWEKLLVQPNTPNINPIILNYKNSNYQVGLTSQYNAINALSTPVLHPQQTFDNVYSVLGYPPDNMTTLAGKAYEEKFERTFELVQFSKDFRGVPETDFNQVQWATLSNLFPVMRINQNTIGLLASENDINKVANQAGFNLQGFQNLKNSISQYPTQSFPSSSFSGNSVIKDFYLYRMVVRYSLETYLVDGTRPQPLSANYKVPLRGELLDISIPRRDSAEALHQYHQVALENIDLTGIYGNGRIKVPNWEYQVQENMLLIIEVIEDRSGSADKIKKRIDRGLASLSYIDQNVFQITINKLILRNQHLYGPLIRLITDANIGTSNRMILIWLLDSLEEDYKLSQVSPPNAIQQLILRFNSLFQSIINDYNEVQATIPQAVRDELDDNKKSFIGTIQLFRKTTKMFGQAIDDTALGIVSNVSNVLTQYNTPNVIGPQMSSILMVRHLGGTPSASSSQFIYPFIDLFLPELNNFSEQNLQSFSTALQNLVNQNGFQLFTFNKDQQNQLTNNSFFILSKNNTTVRLSFNRNIQPNVIQIINGHSILRNKHIIEELNNMITNSKNTHVVHWLDGLREDFQKALTTF